MLSYFSAMLDSHILLEGKLNSMEELNNKCSTVWSHFMLTSPRNAVGL